MGLLGYLYINFSLPASCTLGTYQPGRVEMPRFIPISPTVLLHLSRQWSGVINKVCVPRLLSSPLPWVLQFISARELGIISHLHLHGRLGDLRRRDPNHEHIVLFWHTASMAASMVTEKLGSKPGHSLIVQDGSAGVSKRQFLHQNFWFVFSCWFHPRAVLATSTTWSVIIEFACQAFIGLQL